MKARVMLESVRLAAHNAAQMSSTIVVATTSAGFGYSPLLVLLLALSSIAAGGITGQFVASIPWTKTQGNDYLEHPSTLSPAVVKAMQEIPIETR